MKQDWIEYFDENGYSISENDFSLKIEKKNPDRPLVIYLLILLFIPLVILIAAYKVFLLLILLIFIPFVYTKWNLPFKILIDKNEEIVKVGDFNYNINIIQAFVVSEDIRLSDVSPFKDGCEDFIYEFRLDLTYGKKEKVFELWFRESMEEEMNDLAAYLTLHLGKEES